MSKRISNHESAQQHVESIRRATRKQYSAEEKIRIVLEGLRGEYFIVELCRREGIAQSLYYAWSKEFLKAGKKRLSGNTSREATSDELPICFYSNPIVYGTIWSRYITTAFKQNGNYSGPRLIQYVKEQPR